MSALAKSRTKRLQAAEERKLWTRYIAGGRVDDTLRNRLVTEVLPLAKRLAVQMSRALSPFMPVEDLEQEASIGLLQSAEKFDPDRGCSFRTFSRQRMMGRMIDAARDRDELTRHHRMLVKQRQTFEEEYRQRHGCCPASHVVCEAFGWSERRWMETCTKSARSLEVVVTKNDDSPTLWRDLLAGSAEDPSSKLQVESQTRQILVGLELMDQFIVWAYLFRGKRLHEIASFLGLTESRISQRFTQLKPKLLRRIAAGD